jgi:hypothetical protein
MARIYFSQGAEQSLIDGFRQLDSRDKADILENIQHPG